MDGQIFPDREALCAIRRVCVQDSTPFIMVAFPLALASHQAVLDVLLGGNPKSIKKAATFCSKHLCMKSCQLPALTFALARYCQLQQHAAPSWLRYIHDFEDFCMRHIEHTFLERGGAEHVLLQKAPDSAQMRYTYGPRGAQRQTWADPRTKADLWTSFGHVVEHKIICDSCVPRHASLSGCATSLWYFLIA